MRITKTKGLLLTLIAAMMMAAPPAASPVFGEAGEGPRAAQVVGVFGEIPGQDLFVHL